MKTEGRGEQLLAHPMCQLVRSPGGAWGRVNFGSSEKRPHWSQPLSVSALCLCFLPSTDGAGEKWGPEGWGLGRLCKPPFLFGAHLQRRWGLLFILNSLLSCRVFSSPHSAPFFPLSSCPCSSSSPFGFLSLRGFSWLFPIV